VESAIMANLGDAISHSDPGTAPPEECGLPTAPTDVSDFIDTVRRYAVSDGPVDTSDLDSDLAAIDGDYVCLALQGAHHFRLPEIHGSDAAYVTMPNALGTYSVYHIQALSFAAISAQDVANRERWLGLAILSETFALHFLQDSAAAGHMVVDYGAMNPASVRATHDAYNETGLSVRIPAALCQRLPATRAATFPRLFAACTNAPSTERVGTGATPSFAATTASALEWQAKSRAT
jgi:hypothetical protein